MFIVRAPTAQPSSVGATSATNHDLYLNFQVPLTQVLRWAFWWNSTEESPEDVTSDQVLIELNTDFSMKGLSAQEITAIVAAWQAKAISRDTMTELFRKGEVLPEGRTREEEERLIGPVPEVL
jgi:hypothetical protein